MSRLIRLALASLLAAPVLASAQNLVTNGSFEADAQAPGTWSMEPTLTGWSDDMASIELRNGVLSPAYDGSNYIELRSAMSDAVFQDITTTAGELYTVSFAFAAHNGLALLPNGVEVFWNGVSQGIFYGEQGAAANGWNLVSLTVAGGASTSRLTFRAVGDPRVLGIGLDAVSVTSAVAEPSTVMLMLAGLGAVGFVARRHRKAPGH